jgi:hypothetical protein
MALNNVMHPGLLYSFEVYSIGSSKMKGNSLEVSNLTSTGYLSNSTGSSVTSCQFSLDSASQLTSVILFEGGR